jgi:hypothetical protein
MNPNEPSPAEKFDLALIKRMQELMGSVRFGAAADCFDPAYWRRPDDTSDALALINGKSAAAGATALTTYRVQRPNQVGLETAKLDCVEMIEVARWLAELDVVGIEAFDKKYRNSGFKLDAPGSTGVVGTSLAERDGKEGDDEYDKDGTPLTGTFTFTEGTGEGTVVDLTKHLATLPVGSRVMWRNFDPNVDADDDFKNENTLKIGQDRYAAHPIGAFTLAAMAAKVAVGGYDDMLEAVKEAERKLAKVANQKRKLQDPAGKDKQRAASLDRRISRYREKLATYAGINNQTDYIDRFIRIVETETFQNPCA